MGFLRNSSYPVFVVTMFAVVGCIGLARDVLIGVQLGRELQTRPDPGVAESPMVDRPADPNDPTRFEDLEPELEAALLALEDLSPEEQRERTLELLEAALREGGPLPGAVPIAPLDPPPPNVQRRASMRGGDEDRADRAPLQRVGYQREAPAEPLAGRWVPFVVAGASGGLILFVGLIGAVFLLRRPGEPELVPTPAVPAPVAPREVVIGVDGGAPARVSTPPPAPQFTATARSRSITPSMPPSGVSAPTARAVSAPSGRAAAPPPVPAGVQTVSPGGVSYTDEDVVRAMQDEDEP